MVYIYIHKTERGNYEIDGYDDQTGKDLYKRTYIMFNKRESIASFREYYDIKGRHAEYINY